MSRLWAGGSVMLRSSWLLFPLLLLMSHNAGEKEKAGRTSWSSRGEAGRRPVARTERARGE